MSNYREVVHLNTDPESFRYFTADFKKESVNTNLAKSQIKKIVNSGTPMTPTFLSIVNKFTPELYETAKTLPSLGQFKTELTGASERRYNLLSEKYHTTNKTMAPRKAVVKKAPPKDVNPFKALESTSESSGSSGESVIGTSGDLTKQAYVANQTAGNDKLDEELKGLERSKIDEQIANKKNIFDTQKESTVTQAPLEINKEFMDPEPITTDKLHNPTEEYSPEKAKSDVDSEGPSKSVASVKYTTESSSEVNGGSSSESSEHRMSVSERAAYYEGLKKAGWTAEEINIERQNFAEEREMHAKYGGSSSGSESSGFISQFGKELGMSDSGYEADSNVTGNTAASNPWQLWAETFRATSQREFDDVLRQITSNSNFSSEEKQTIKESLTKFHSGDDIDRSDINNIIKFHQITAPSVNISGLPNVLAGDDSTPDGTGPSAISTGADGATPQVADGTGPFAVNKVISHAPKYHLDSILFYFGSKTDPDWDRELENNVFTSGMSKPDIIKSSDAVITNYGSILFAFSRKSDTLAEFHELIQLQFCYLRNLARGTRTKMAMVPISALTGFAAKLAGGADQPAPAVDQTERNDFVEPLESVSQIDEPIVSDGMAPSVGLPSSEQPGGSTQVQVPTNISIDKVVDAYRNRPFGIYNKPIYNKAIQDMTLRHPKKYIGANSGTDVFNIFAPKARSRFG